MNRGAVAEINLSAVAHNLHSVKKLVKNRPIFAVVKADAYGHGSVEVSRSLLRQGASHLAVAFISEAIELREAGINEPILVFFDRGDIKQFFDFKLIPVIYSVDTALSLSSEARKRGSLIKVHIKVDTGMGRLGLSGKHVMKDLMKISEMEGLEIDGLMSHFSEADLSDMSYAVFQLKRFQEIRKAFSAVARRKIFSHIANSAAVLSFQNAYLDAVRPGLILYGYTPFGENTNQRMQIKESYTTIRNQQSETVKLIPVMKIITKILCIRKLPSGSPISYGRTFVTQRPSRIGVVPLGYADGYSRLFSNNAEVLVKGKRVPVVGRICMDLMMVDLTDVKGIRENDEVVILGKQGKESITAQELASRAHTIPYEILTSLGSKSKKTYVHAKSIKEDI